MLMQLVDGLLHIDFHPAPYGQFFLPDQAGRHAVHHQHGSKEGGTIQAGLQKRPFRLQHQHAPALPGEQPRAADPPGPFAGRDGKLKFESDGVLAYIDEVDAEDVCLSIARTYFPGASSILSFLTTLSSTSME